jgi:hypothetical protein
MCADSLPGSETLTCRSLSLSLCLSFLFSDLLSNNDLFTASLFWNFHHVVCHGRMDH